MKTLLLATAAFALVAANASAQPAPLPRPAVLRGAVALRGFSVVLVAGDTQGPSSSEGIPEAAGHALADLKAFLPYKAYQLLDTEWTMGGDKTRTILAGPDGHTYELYLTAEPASPTEVQITGFRLQEFGPGAAMIYTRGGTSASADKMNADAEELAKKIADAAKQSKDKSGAQDPATAALIQKQVEMARANVIARVQGRSVIDTSFRMNIGETVVVGTSRLQGSKALVVLLTAVGR